MNFSPTLLSRNVYVFHKCLFWMVRPISKEKVCHFIAAQWEIHDVSFTLSYAMFLRLSRQIAKFLVVLLTVTKTEMSDDKWQKSAHQV